VVERSVDVVVVGAGVAGLLAARRVAAAGASVAVLEARPDRVGGRVETVVLDGERVDVGGTWIGAQHERARRLVAELGLELRPTHLGGRAVVAEHGRVVGEREHALRHPLAEIEQRRAAAWFERFAATVPPDAPWTAPDAERLDSITFAVWLERRAAITRRARRTIRQTAANLLPVAAEEVSLLHVLAFLASNGGWRAALGTAGGAQQDMVAGGAQRIAEALSEALAGALTLGAPVRSIARTEGGVRVVADGAAVSARAAVVALPPRRAAEIEFTPALPDARLDLARRVPEGDAIKVVAVYDDPFWRGAGLSGESWGADVPYSYSYDVSEDAGPGVIAAFFVDDDARARRAMPAERRDEALREGLGRCFGPNARAPRALVERDWSADEWTHTGYGAFMPPRAWVDHRDALRAPHGPVSFAGAETAARGMGYVEGAIESGERAAAEALATLGAGRLPA
jgi:monoamine oxidase